MQKYYNGLSGSVFLTYIFLYSLAFFYLLWSRTKFCS